MHWASVLGDSQLVECLLQYGAAAAGSSGMVTVCSTRGLSALHCAASVGSVAVCEHLLSANAMVHTHTHTQSHTHTHILVHTQSYLLTHSLTHSPTHSLARSLTHTYSLTHSHTHSLTHSLTHTHAHTHTLALILNLTFAVQINSEDSEGMSALHRASRFGHTDCVRTLLSHDATISTLSHTKR